MYFTVKPQEGIVATSFKPGDKVFIGGDKLLPLEKCVLTFLSLRCPYYLCAVRTDLFLSRFLPKPKPPPGAAKPKRAGGARGGRGGAPRGRGGFGARGGAPRGRGGFGAGRGRGGGGSFGGRGGGFSRGGGRGGSRGGFRGRG